MTVKRIKGAALQGRLGHAAKVSHQDLVVFTQEKEVLYVEIPVLVILTIESFFFLVYNF